MPALEGVGESQTTWKNTLAAFKRQFTQIDKLMSDAKLPVKISKIPDTKWMPKR